MNEISSLKLPIEIKACSDVSLSAGKLVLSMSGLKSEVKKDAYVESHHAVVTKADEQSQSEIMKALNNQFSKAYFIVEEKCKDKELVAKVLNETNFKKFLKNVFLIDALDGTSQKARDSYIWSVSVGHMSDGQLQGGSIFCPAILNGLQVFGTKDKSYFRENVNLDNTQIQDAKVSQTQDLKQSRVYIGADLLQNKAFTNFLLNMANRTRTHSVANSCAVALSEIACGKADAIVQTIQSPWDFAAGIPLVQGAGGLVQFYHVEKSGICLIDKLGAEDFDPARRTVGFVAGNNKKIVTELTDQLVDEYKP